ncbi:MAG: transposase [Endomicrobia bacterium]|nr:transposase [Endomicrobiia bacterium]
MINDRISFQRFLGLDMDSSIPDATTIWLFREKLTIGGHLKELFEEFNRQLDAKGYIRCRTFKRAQELIALKNLAYNIKRSAFLHDHWVAPA